MWLAIIKKMQKFKDYQCFPTRPKQFTFADFEETHESGEDPKLWVYADYMKPTHRVEKLFLHRDGETSHYYEEFFISEVRKETIEVFKLDKSYKTKQEIPFDHKKSIFKQWQKDTPSVLNQTITFDLGYWKATKFVRDPEDFKQCEALIIHHFVALKHIFVNLISSDNYPHIGWNDFVAFCRHVEILDGTLPTATVDRMFIATKVGAPKEGNGNTLFRHEFLEIMIRIANSKYKETG